MPKVRCECGAVYQVKESSLGRHAVCRQCGQRLLLTVSRPEAAPIPLAPRVDLSDEVEAASRRTIEAPAGLKMAGEAKFTAKPEDFGYARPRPSPAMTIPKTSSPYFKDILWTFLMFTNPHNIAILVGIWVFMQLVHLAVALFAFRLWFGVLGFIVAYGLYASFQLNVVAAAANGEDDLPSLTPDDGLWGLFPPIINYVGAWLVSRLPVILYLIYVLSHLPASGRTGLTFYDFFMGTLNYGKYAALYQQTGINGFILTLCIGLGYFLWPMLLLVAALGGVTALVRLDLMLWTILKSFPAYLCTVGLVYGGLILEVLAAVLMAKINPSGGRLFMAVVVLSFMDLYFTTATMRVVGLYYHHFKHRFAWSWG